MIRPMILTGAIPLSSALSSDADNLTTRSEGDTRISSARSNAFRNESEEIDCGVDRLIRVLEEQILLSFCQAWFKYHVLHRY